MGSKLKKHLSCSYVKLCLLFGTFTPYLMNQAYDARVQTQGFGHQFHQNWGQNEKLGWNLYIMKNNNGSS